MGKINVLSFEVANLIAAGEVVDRPASAVKELVENSIDAGADRITVEIQHGGIRFMRVTDNGGGILPEDLPVAVRRHATSKIESEKDLAAIGTLGFRGEALAAIGAVSDLRIISKTKDAAMGASIEVHSGRVGAVTEQGAADGTTVIAENLFANVPARLKFLKRDLTEASAVISIVEKIALSHPEIAFRVISDGSLKLETSGDGNLSAVIRAVYGKEYSASMIRVRSGLPGITVSGFITAPDQPRANRNYQVFFINGRFVKIRTASAALEQAYVSYIPPGKFPGCVMEISIRPEAVDVNVHPAKLEVKFSDERPVFDAVYRAARDALLGNTERAGLFGKQDDKPPVRLSGAMAPVTDVGKPEPALTVFDGIKIDSRPADSVTDGSSLPNHSDNAQPSSGRPAEAYTARGIPGGTSSALAGAPEKPQEPFSKNPGTVYGNQAKHAEGASQTAVGGVAGNKSEENGPARGTPGSFRVVGELFNTYVIVEERDRVTVFDKHATHERIIFEKLRRNLKNALHPVTLLACPVELILMKDDCSLLEAHRREIEDVGFEFLTSGSRVIITGIPLDVTPAAASDMFESFADVLGSGQGSVGLIGDTVFEKALYRASCKAAIKGGRSYPEGYIEYLAGELLRTPEVVCCPHGRPVAFEFTKNEADRRFGRI